MTGVVTLGTVRYTLVKNGGRVQVLTGGATGPTGATGATGAAGADADIAADTNAATSKATPVDADEIPLVDSAATWGLKKLTWANLKATLKAYFDTLYLPTQGTFTPSLTFGGASVGLAYSFRTGQYTKAGNAVHFKLYIILSNIGSSTGAAKVTGLPFTSDAGTFSAVSIYTVAATGVSGGVMGLVEQSASEIRLAYSDTGAGTIFTHANATNTLTLVISGTYFV